MEGLEYDCGINKFVVRNEKWCIEFNNIHQSEGHWRALVWLYRILPNEKKLCLTDIISLTSSRSQIAIADSIFETLADEDITFWRAFIKEACLLFLEKFLNKNETIFLEEQKEIAQISQPEFLIYPFIYKNQVNMIFGSGSTYKSFLALFFSKLIDSNKVLYLDYETDEAEIKRRMNLIGISGLFYRQCDVPITHPQLYEKIAEFVFEKKIELLILDSLATALMGEDLNDVSAPSRLFGILRSFKTTILLIGHHAKGIKELPYGSIFFYNLPRNIWKTDIRTTADGSRILILTNEKNNLAPIQPPQAFKITFDPSFISFIPVNITDYQELEDKLPLKERITKLLLNSPNGLTVKEISNLLDEKDTTLIRATLNKYQDTFLKEHNGNKITWKLKNL